MCSKSLACRLIKASNLAYSISEDGTRFEDTAQANDDINAVGFIKDSLKIYQAPREDKINACYYGETASEAILAFRGTLPPTLESPEDFFKSLVDWINDAEIKLVKGANLAGLVHKGFLESLDALWDWISQLKLEDVAKNKKSLLITGHSKGGALVYLAAYRLARLGIPVTAAYSYAAPRPGDQAFADAFEQFVQAGNTGIQEACRFEFRDDLVPHLPPATGSWRSIQNGLTSIHKQFPFEAPHLSASPRVAQDAEKFLAQLDAVSNLPPYASVGELQFIDWDNAIVGDSLWLTTKRNLHLAEVMAELKFVEIAQDHASDGGYMQIPCSLSHP